MSERIEPEQPEAPKPRISTPDYQARRLMDVLWNMMLDSAVVMPLPRAIELKQAVEHWGKAWRHDSE